MKIDNEKLDLVMAERGLNNSELAALMGVAPATLSVMLNRTAKVRPKSINRIAAALGVPVKELL